MTAEKSSTWDVDSRSAGIYAFFYWHMSRKTTKQIVRHIRTPASINTNGNVGTFDVEFFWCSGARMLYLLPRKAAHSVGTRPQPLAMISSPLGWHHMAILGHDIWWCWWHWHHSRCRCICTEQSSAVNSWCLQYAPEFHQDHATACL